MYQSRTPQSGYTLIEVLVASAIFVGVMIIGTGSFTSVTRIQEQNNYIRAMTQTANFVLETMARDVQTASGIRNPNNPSLFTSYPFDITNQGVIASAPSGTAASGGMITGNGLIVRQADGQVETYRIAVHPRGSTHTILQKNSQNLVPANFAVNDVSIRGITHRSFVVNGGNTLVRIQPYVQIRFTLVNLDLEPENPSAAKEFETLIASREYIR